MTLGRPRVLGLVVGLVLLGASVPVLARGWWRWREANAVTRGARLAQASGCAACHLPPGGKEIPNPGSRWGTVPVWGGGSLMMYADSREGTASIIREGSPKPSSSYAPLIRMPAYGAFLSRRDVDDLVAYVRALDRSDSPEGNPPRSGYEAAARAGCFGCHGPEGHGGVPNPGSLKGYVPGFYGKDFAELVTSQAEFEEWVRQGMSARVFANPLARHFLRSQRITMPAFPRAVVSESDVEAIWAWRQTQRTQRQ